MPTLYRAMIYQDFVKETRRSAQHNQPSHVRNGFYEGAQLSQRCFEVVAYYSTQHFVWVAGFEPALFRPLSERLTKLAYTQIMKPAFIFLAFH